MGTSIRWLVKGIEISRQESHGYNLLDSRGREYYQYPQRDNSAEFSITGVVDWVSPGAAWTREKVDGLIPYLNKALKEYEDDFQSRTRPA